MTLLWQQQLELQLELHYITLRYTTCITLHLHYTPLHYSTLHLHYTYTRPTLHLDYTTLQLQHQLQLQLQLHYIVLHYTNYTTLH